MQPSEVLDTLRRYVGTEILNGKDLGLNGKTPLLEWGILNSLELTRLLAFAQKTYSIQVPPQLVIAENFKDLATIAELLVRLQTPSCV
jgi:acyl carrier protein